MKKNLLAIILLLSLSANMAYAEGGRGGEGWHGGGRGGEGWHEGYRGGRGDGGLALMFGLGLASGVLLQPATVYSRPVYAQPVYIQAVPVYVQTPYIQPAPLYPPVEHGQISYGPTTYYNGFEPH